MADSSVVNVVREYLHNLAQQGIVPSAGILFGSQSRGETNAWSDIDLLVIAPVFDGTFSRDLVNQLWRVAARTDSRIEPIPCGERQWEEDIATPIIEIARREGVQVTV